MPAVWKHKQLGEFAFRHRRWVGEIPLPGFRVFGRRSSAPVPLGFQKAFIGPDANSRPPKAAAVKVACRLLENHRAVAGMITDALWDEFQGRGPTSGYWWFGQLDDIQDTLERLDLPPLESAKDVARVLKKPQIDISPWLRGREEPFALILFHSPIEDEHGIGVVTDGDQILATGYASDGEFDVRKAVRRRKR